MSFSPSELIKFFSLPPEGYRYIFQQIPNIYQQQPTIFANIFFDILPTMDPKSVRIICYQLYTAGINLNEVYKQRSDAIPKFLSELNKFPLESIMVILKYKFPAYPKDDLFFLSSFGLEDNTDYSSYPSALNWLDFILDVCIHQRINLNHINKSTGSTCLHSAIRMGSLSLVKKLLLHRVDPNTKSIQGISPLFSAIEALELPDAEETYKVYIEIIRSLRVYGAKIDNTIKEQIKVSSYKNQVDKAISSAEMLKPEYSSPKEFYFSLDQTEDLVLIAELDPTIMDDPKFPQITPTFKYAIQRNIDKTIFVNDVMLTWPYYVDDTVLKNNQHCYLELDKRPTADSPSS